MGAAYTAWNPTWSATATRSTHGISMSVTTGSQTLPGPAATGSCTGKDSTLGQLRPRRTLWQYCSRCLRFTPDSDQPFEPEHFLLARGKAVDARSPGENSTTSSRIGLNLPH